MKRPERIPIPILHPAVFQYVIALEGYIDWLEASVIEVHDTLDEEDALDRTMRLHHEDVMRGWNADALPNEGED